MAENNTQAAGLYRFDAELESVMKIKRMLWTQ